MKAIFYFFKKNAKINGTLFYCFEYFAFCRSLNVDVKFYLYQISEKDLDYVKGIFKNKYQVNDDVLNSIEAVNFVNEIYQLKIQKALILDIHSFNQIYYFIPCDIICYSNEAHGMIRSDKKNIEYYGFYKYQNFDVSEKLKLNFNIFKPIKESKEKSVFVSSRLFNYKDFNLPQELADYQIITKHEDEHRENMFELFDTVYYYHSALDTNNRLIPECFFYNKKIVIEYNGKYDDSIYLRYTDIKENGLAPYTLDENDLMVKGFLA